MSLSVPERIMACPRFQRLAAARSRFAWTLAALVLALYYGYMLLVAFAPQVLGARLAEGGATTWGVPVGAAIIVFSWLMTGLYIRRANVEFDALTDAILEEHAR